jgi:hypothetical protein
MKLSYADGSVQSMIIQSNVFGVLLILRATFGNVRFQVYSVYARVYTGRRFTQELSVEFILYLRSCHDCSSAHKMKNRKRENAVGIFSTPAVNVKTEEKKTPVARMKTPTRRKASR